MGSLTKKQVLALEKVPTKIETIAFRFPTTQEKHNVRLELYSYENEPNLVPNLARNKVSRHRAPRAWYHSVSYGDEFEKDLYYSSFSNDELSKELIRLIEERLTKQENFTEIFVNELLYAASRILYYPWMFNFMKAILARMDKNGDLRLTIELKIEFERANLPDIVNKLL